MVPKVARGFSRVPDSEVAARPTGPTCERESTAVVHRKRRNLLILRSKCHVPEDGCRLKMTVNDEDGVLIQKGLHAWSGKMCISPRGDATRPERDGRERFRAKPSPETHYARARTGKDRCFFRFLQFQLFAVLLTALSSFVS